MRSGLRGAWGRPTVSVTLSGTSIGLLTMAWCADACSLALGLGFSLAMTRVCSVLSGWCVTDLVGPLVGAGAMVAMRLGLCCVDVGYVGLCRSDWIVFQTLGGRVRWAFFLPITCVCSMFYVQPKMNESLSVKGTYHLSGVT